MSEGPKLFVNKPKKDQLKQHQSSPSSSSSASASMATSTASSAPASSPPPPKESFARRYKFIWPLLLAVNFSIGAYLFMRTKKKDIGSEEEEFEATAPTATTAATIVAVTEKPVIRPPMTEPIKLRDPIPEDQQRELFKWLLEEKRKIKPRDREERKRIDEEKAILKQFIRAKSIPTL